jgi:hypothetical protein
VRIKRTDGSFVVLRDPAVLSDSLVGWEADRERKSALILFAGVTVATFAL